MRARLSFACLVFLIMLITVAQAGAVGGSRNAVQVVIGSGTAASCQSIAAADDFNAAVSAGGVIDFNCGPDPVVVTVQTNVTDQEVTVNGGSRITLSGENRRQIFVVTGFGHLILNDLTLQDGYAQMGGAIEIQYDAGATINHTVLRSNSAPGGGGAIFNVGTLLIEDSTISGNSSSTGGGIFNTSCVSPEVCTTGKTTINNSTIADNAASWGGGIASAVSSLVISGSTLANNSASSGGGGIYNCNSTLLLTSSTLIGNTGDQGGGVTNCGVATISESTLAGNAASYGGGINNSVGTLLLLNSTLSGNSAIVGGGGLYNDGSATVGNSTLSANSASSGGGIFNFGQFQNLTLNNSLVANSGGGDCASTGGFSASHSLIEDGDSACGLSNGDNGNIVGQDPLLGPLQHNGGPTQTHELMAGSAAIDAGGNNLAAGLENDQRGAGFPRIVGTAVDMGAFEFAGSAPPPAWPVYLPFTTRP